MARKEKTDWMKQTIEGFFSKTPAGAIDKDKLLAEFCLEFNSTERTGKEILKILNSTGLIKEVEGLIYKNEKRNPL